MRIEARMAEVRIKGFQDNGCDRVFEPIGLSVNDCPVEFQSLDQKCLDEPMPPQNVDRRLGSFRRQLHPAVSLGLDELCLGENL